MKNSRYAQNWINGYSVTQIQHFNISWNLFIRYFTTAWLFNKKLCFAQIEQMGHLWAEKGKKMKILQNLFIKFFWHFMWWQISLNVFGMFLFPDNFSVRIRRPLSLCVCFCIKLQQTFSKGETLTRIRTSDPALFW